MWINERYELYEYPKGAELRTAVIYGDYANIRRTEVGRFHEKPFCVRDVNRVKAYFVIMRDIFGLVYEISVKL